MTKTAGASLKELLESILSSDGGDNLCNAADKFFIEEGALQSLFNESVLYYCLRRILHTINYKLERQDISVTNADEILDITRNYFLENTNIPFDSPLKNELSILVLSCIDANRKGISKSMRRRILEEQEREGVRFCYMCGVELNYDHHGRDESATLDHVFPHEYGGDSEIENLKISCKKCNDTKGSYISAPDFHFESISTKHDVDHSKFKGQLFRRPNAIAIRSKNEFKCTICDETASKSGFLRAYQLDNNQGWHFMNIGCKCEKHD